MIINLRVFTSSGPASKKRIPKYTALAIIIFKINIGNDDTKNFVNSITANITAAAASCLNTGFISENSIYFLAITNTIIDVVEIAKEAIANPLNPYCIIAIGVTIQVAIVQKTIKIRVIFTFPTAIKKLVKGVEIEEKIVFSAKNDKDRIAGSHFSYLGIRFIKNGEY